MKTLYRRDFLKTSAQLAVVAAISKRLGNSKPPKPITEPQPAPEVSSAEGTLPHEHLYYQYPNIGMIYKDLGTPY